MKKILGLDMATKTGWAINSSPESSGCENFAVRRGESPGMRYIRFQAWLAEIVNLTHPELIVYEQAHHRGGAATEVCLGLATHLQSFCAKHEIDFSSVHSSVIKKFATGKGNAGKEMMMEAYSANFGVQPIDDNECDARWILEWAKTQF